MGARHCARLGRRARRRSGCDHRGMSDWDELVKDLQDRRDAARAMGGTERLDQQRRDGRLDARARIDRLLDDDTFVELGTLVGSVHRGVVPPVPADGLIAGHGLIDGRPVLVGAEDFTVMGGSIGRGTTAKRQRLAELAGQERVPLVMLLEGAGERTQNAFEALGLVRRYLGYFPSNAWQLSPAQAGADDTAARGVDVLTDLIPADPRRGYDIRPVVELIADRGSVLEIEPAFGRPIVTALVRLGGVPVAVVANQPAAKAGALDSEGADKAAHFIDVVDAFHLPLVFLADNPGVLAGTAGDRSGVLRHPARMVAAQARVRSLQ